MRLLSMITSQSEALLAGGEHKFLADHKIDGRILMPVSHFASLQPNFEALGAILTASLPSIL